MLHSLKPSCASIYYARLPRWRQRLLRIYFLMIVAFLFWLIWLYAFFVRLPDEEKPLPMEWQAIPKIVSVKLKVVIFDVL